MDRWTEPKDINVTCLDCQSTFTFTAGEQLFYMSKGLIMPPRRCPDCRRRRRLTINPDPRQNHG